jgi:hypothetical protein
MQYLFLFILSGSLSIVLTLLVKHFSTKKNILDIPDNNQRKIHKKPIPLLGGLAIIGSIILSLILYIAWFNPNLQVVPLKFFLGILLASFVLALGGFWDDKHNLPPKVLWIFPALASLIIVLSGIGVGIKFISNPFGGSIYIGQAVSIFNFKVSLSAFLVWIWLMGMIFTTKFLDGCDRVGLVEEKGEVVDASFVGTLIGREVLRSHPHALMLYDLRSSMIVKEVWEENGATTAMCKVGHANIKPLLLENEAAFASELSLHLYYHDFYNVECSDLSLLYILQALSREQEPLSALIQPFKKYVHSGEINFEIQNKDEVMKRIEETYGESALEISHLDGLWMKFNWGWVSVRSSNTEPVMRLNLEAKSEEVMKEKIEEFKVLIIDK